MIVTWEITDIVPGQRFGSIGCSEQWIIGYHPATGQKAVVSLSDGMIARLGPESEILEFLNADKGATQPLELLERPRRGPDPKTRNDK